MYRIHLVSEELTPFFMGGTGLIELLQRQAGGHAPDPESKNSAETKTEEEDLFCCAVCLHSITHKVNAFSVLGQHEHYFTNPHGHQFLIGCFDEASGCRNTGDWVSQYSWFAGYLWRYSLCDACQTHLGWQFRSDHDSFYGLISTRLISSEKLQ